MMCWENSEGSLIEEPDKETDDQEGRAAEEMQKQKDEEEHVNSTLHTGNQPKIYKESGRENNNVEENEKRENEKNTK